MLGLTLWAVFGLQAAAELVILSNGHVIKVVEYQRKGRKVHLTLPSGGSLELPLMGIERIVDDEIVEDPFTLGESGGRLDLTFRESHPIPETPFGELIYETAKRYGINPQLIAAMVRAESAFDPDAVSVKGASGLLQLMPATAARFGLEAKRLFDPARNLDAGVHYVQWLSERFSGRLPEVLAGYNAGEETVDRYGGVPPYRETQNYIRRIYLFLGSNGAAEAR